MVQPVQLLCDVDLCGCTSRKLSGEGAVVLTTSHCFPPTVLFGQRFGIRGCWVWDPDRSAMNLSDGPWQTTQRKSKGTWCEKQFTIIYTFLKLFWSLLILHSSASMPNCGCPHCVVSGTQAPNDCGHSHPPPRGLPGGWYMMVKQLRWRYHAGGTPRRRMKVPLPLVDSTCRPKGEKKKKNMCQPSRCGCYPESHRCVIRKRLARNNYLILNHLYAVASSGI